MVKIEDVKKLREITGAGMMDCKKALSESDGDADLAVEWLRKKGISQAAKKNSRTASDGLLGVLVEDSGAAIIEVNSETDFVARNEQFQNLVRTVLDNAINCKNNIDDLNSSALPNGQKVSDYIVESIGSLGENIVIRRVSTFNNSDCYISSYIHNAIDANLGKIAVLVKFKVSKVTEDVKQIGRQIAMHIAASRPVSVNSNDVPAELVQKEREIFSEQAKASGKPDNIIEKMVEGRIRKYFEEVVLLDQVFVIDGKTKISEAVANFNKSNNSDIEVIEFIRYELGEGIDKEESNFAEEVSSMSAGS
ncbi:MAG: elongation factor Ts [Rickettsiales bacterium]|jgi:elongation factor Ts|nr:elongation factor Ts [Rickettsiales bacterium]